MKFFLFWFVFFSPSILVAQKSDVNSFGKRLIDSSVYIHAGGSWAQANSPALSADGRYVLYRILNEPLGTSAIIVESVDSIWREVFKNCVSARFTTDCRRVILAKSGGGMEVVELGDTAIEYIPDVDRFDLIKCGADELLLYERYGKGKSLIIRNLATNREKSIDGYKDYQFGTSKNVIILSFETGAVSDAGERIDLVDLHKFVEVPVFNGGHASDFIFSGCGDSSMCFNVEGRIYYYKVGMAKAELLVDSSETVAGGRQPVRQLLGFAHNGQLVFFETKCRSNIPGGDKGKLNRVNIWRYNDARLETKYLKDLENDDNCNNVSVISIRDRRITKLTFKDEEVCWASSFDNPNTIGDYLVVINRGGVDDEWNWNKESQPKLFLVAINDGSRRQIMTDCGSSNSFYCHFSPDGKYLVYFDARRSSYMSYSILTDKYWSITDGVKAKWTEANDNPDSWTRPLWIAGFILKDTSVIIYEQNDIFKVSLLNRFNPINLTTGIRNKRNMVFRFSDDYHQGIIDPNQRFLLNVFNLSNKDNGFYSMTIGRVNQLDSLVMEPCIFEGPGDLSGEPHVKADAAEVYVVRKMNSYSMPNYFLTYNFKSFFKLTDLHPERNYNWLKSELVVWKMFDGKLSQGILYKPEDFDSTRKYPIIFYYYEKLSNDLHSFIFPNSSEGPINIPFYVSNGYLIFVPDIHYKIGYPGESAYNSVVSAALYLSKKPWVDNQKMGIQGHSFGGYETDYLISHTHMFAAACSAAGWANFIRAYGEIRNEDGTSRQGYYELRRERMGVSLWERPDLYIRNSPIFYANRINTPLLMMNNRGDDEVSFAEGEEFFGALRRLGKRVWMLEYKNGDHIVRGVDRIDFSVRMKQFFDYYLKGKQLPRWMLGRELPNGDVNDSGFDLEKIGTQPGSDLLTPDAKNKIGALNH